MSCNTNSDSCGCLYPSNTNCVFIKGINSSCLNIQNGDTLTEALNTVIEELCNLTPSGTSGNDIVVSNGTGITITSAVIGTTTTYTVALNNTVQTTLTNLVTDVNALELCVADSIQELTTSTVGMTVTDNGVSGCGKTWSIDYSPSGITSFDGIVYNNIEKSAYTNTVGSKLLKAYVRPYVSVNNITDGDDIIFTATGQIKGDGDVADTVKLELWSGGLPVYSQSFGGFSAGNTSYSSWLAKIVLTVSDQSAGDGLLNLEFSANIEGNGTSGVLGKNSMLQVNKDISGIDYDDLEVKVIYVHDSTSTDSVNFARQLKVEVRKNIAI